MVFLLPALYLLSGGPVRWMRERGWINDETITGATGMGMV
jgi:hypothetical protein